MMTTHGSIDKTATDFHSTNITAIEMQTRIYHQRNLCACAGPTNENSSSYVRIDEIYMLHTAYISTFSTLCVDVSIDAIKLNIILKYFCIILRERHQNPSTIARGRTKLILWTFFVSYIDVCVVSCIHNHKQALCMSYFPFRIISGLLNYRQLLWKSSPTAVL